MSVQRGVDWTYQRVCAVRRRQVQEHAWERAVHRVRPGLLDAGGGHGRVRSVSRGDVFGVREAPGVRRRGRLSHHEQTNLL